MSFVLLDPCVQKILLASFCITGLWLPPQSWRLLVLGFVISSACGADALEEDLRCGSSGSVLKHDGMSLAGISVWVQPLCMILWVQITGRVNCYAFWEAHKKCPSSPVSSRLFLKIRHFLLSLRFSRDFCTVCKKSDFPQGSHISLVLILIRTSIWQIILPLKLNE